jgi:Tfp pilus assembly protein PilX
MTLSYKKQLAQVQRGAALITVLIILIIVTLLGVTAMRMGMSSLALATSSQVSQILFESADVGTEYLNRAILADGVTAMNTGGLIGVTSGADGVVGVVTSLCVTPVTGSTTNLTAGTCNADSKPNHYLSKRGVALAQVTYRRLTVSEGDSNNAEEDISQGGGTSATGSSERLKVYSTAVVPSFGSANTATINACLKKPSDDDEPDTSTVTTVTDCLTDAGAVFTTHSSEYRITR